MKRILSVLMAVTIFTAVIPFSGVYAQASEIELSDTASTYTQSVTLTEKKAETKTAKAAKEPAADIVNPFANIISMIKDLIEVIKAAIAFINADMPGLPFSLKK